MEGIEVDPEKVQTIRNWQILTTVQRVQSFLGFCNFYQQFIKEYSHIARPLYILTKKNHPFL
jgi:hypothetical protein